MKCFQILNSEVLIINEEKMYKDSPDNFIMTAVTYRLAR